MSIFGNEGHKPMLTEPGVKYYINESLKQCHKFKEKHQNTMLNIWLFVVFVIVLGILLLYKYKGKLTVEQIEENEITKKHYILSKIKITGR